MRKTLVFAAAFLCAAAGFAVEANIDAGKAAFGAQCARCHGPTGHGDGVDAKRLYVTPRNLTSGTFKFRTTASGTPPTDDDLLWVLNHGMSGAGMPSFANLELDTKRNIIAYIKTLSPVFAQYPPQPVAPPNEKLRVDPSKGAAAYEKLQCFQCHGKNGRANGPSSPTLKDENGNPIRPANLTQGWTYRAGNSPKDIYYRLMTGLSGTPMPSYDGAVSAEEAWQLANYVSSLQLTTHWAYLIHAVKATGALPTTPDDPAWKTAPNTDVNLQAYFYQGTHREFMSVNAVSVQALHDDKNVALRLFWNDSTESKNPPDSMIVAVKPADFKGSTRANLQTLYSSNYAGLDIRSWQATDPNSSQKVAKFEDGAWTLVMTLPLDVEKGDITVGFAGANGDNHESQVKRSASQWLTLTAREASSHH